MHNPAFQSTITEILNFSIVFLDSFQEVAVKSELTDSQFLISLLPKFHGRLLQGYSARAFPFFAPGVVQGCSCLQEEGEASRLDK